MAATAFINHELFGRIESDLLKLQAIHRAAPVLKGMRAAVTVVAKRTREKIPRGKRTGKNQGKPHLKDAVGTSVKQDDNTGRLTGRVVWNRKKGGYHGHLVEKGHKTKNGDVKGKLYLAQSWDETQQQQMAQLENGVKKALEGRK